MGGRLAFLPRLAPTAAPATAVATSAGVVRPCNHRPYPPFPHFVITVPPGGLAPSRSPAAAPSATPAVPASIVPAPAATTPAGKLAPFLPPSPASATPRSILTARMMGKTPASHFSSLMRL